MEAHKCELLEARLLSVVLRGWHWPGRGCPH